MLASAERHQDAHRSRVRSRPSASQRHSDAAIQRIELGAVQHRACRSNFADADAAADHQIRIVRRHTVVNADGRDTGPAGARDPWAPVFQTRVVDHQQIGALEGCGIVHDPESHRPDSASRRAATAHRQRDLHREVLRERAGPHQVPVTETGTSGDAHDATASLL